MKSTKMDFRKGQKVQAIDELERWEEARVLYRDVDLDEFRVNFTEWGKWFDLTGRRNILWNPFRPQLCKFIVLEHIDPYNNKHTTLRALGLLLNELHYENTCANKDNAQLHIVYAADQHLRFCY